MRQAASGLDVYAAVKGRVISRMTINHNLLAMELHAYRSFWVLSLLQVTKLIFLNGAKLHLN
jgi:hypothetical protein